jgi:hypothetical protein
MDGHAVQEKKRRPRNQVLLYIAGVYMAVEMIRDGKTDQARLSDSLGTAADPAKALSPRATTGF